ncbi:MAG: hypothetical protein WDO71_02865 [Bacteroidota bacterium]
MKIFITIFITLLMVSAKGQKSLDCLLLQAAIETEQFTSTFYACKDSLEIHIVDTVKYFENCILKDVCGKRVVFTHEPMDVNTKRMIEVYRISKRGNVFSLYFHRPFTGAVLILKLKYKNGKTKLIAFETGAF